MVEQRDIDLIVKKLELDGEKPTSVVETRAFIDGKYVDAKTGKTLESLNPATGKVIAKIAACEKEDVDAAVTAARKAFESGIWSRLPPVERKNILLKFADLIEANLLELAVIEAVEAGRPISDIINGDIPDVAGCFRYHAEAINKLYDHICPTGPDNLGLIVREPIGVCGFIVPWNFALLMAAWKLAPSLATGNTVVLKPAELTSLTAIRVAQLAKEAGIPDGVLNVVPGFGATAGSAISLHMDIDMVGFTGSTLTGRTVLRSAAESNLKKVTLECGGKSPQIVFDDVENLDNATRQIMNAAFWNMGENCSCGSRLLVQSGIKQKILERLVELSKEEWKVGNPLTLGTRLGSMISEMHAKKVLGYIEKGKAEGARLVTGGERVLSESGGDFVSLTIFDKVKNDMSIAQEEIFGPVLSVIEFSDEEEAVRLANDSEYGLAASVYTSNINRATRVTRKLRAGNISVNCFAEGDATTPFGGFKQSGFVGRDKSIFAHDQYTELKTIWYAIEN